MNTGGIPRNRIAGVFLVGGASRIPLVATVVNQVLQIPPTAIEQPELVVGEGSLLVQSVVAMSGTPAPAPAPAPAPSADAATARVAAPVPAAPVPAAPVPAAPVPAAPTPPAPPAGERPPPRDRTRRASRWVVAGVVVTVLAVAVIAAVALWPKKSPNQGATTPTACALATLARGSDPLPNGSPVDLNVALPNGWQTYVDPSGFQISYPPQWGRLGSGGCVGNTGEGRYLSIAGWSQTDTNLVGYWTAKESQIRGSLSGYQRKVIKPRENYWDSGADWEFLFTDNGEPMHAIGVAVLTAGGRGHGYFWVTKNSAWTNSLPDFTRVTGTFRPAS
jgi:hypothetical protein